MIGRISVKKRYLRGLLAALAPWVVVGWVIADPISAFIAGMVLLVAILSVMMFDIFSQP